MGCFKTGVLNSDFLYIEAQPDSSFILTSCFNLPFCSAFITCSNFWSVE
ncbi:hypothetical protein LDVICp120 [lymphocystis disease virus-China]|uniref:Uncharacterized protein n=1 Tax=lymphocystis disease virus-China TaxID=256729 RepID=Q677Z2_9VIRU|nr:hypothetical protein LDVICp120 [lymphocystis disease virus-China]AAU10965.1 hypothetical protein [lymphocystis disease virus-China]